VESYLINNGIVSAEDQPLYKPERELLHELKYASYQIYQFSVIKFLKASESSSNNSSLKESDDENYERH
jgi:hypothetical protein